jgi:hypothetical protein
MSGHRTLLWPALEGNLVELISWSLSLPRCLLKKKIFKRCVKTGLTPTIMAFVSYTDLCLYLRTLLWIELQFYTEIVLIDKLNVCSCFTLKQEEIRKEKNGNGQIK